MEILPAGREPEIHYPTAWAYRIIGEDEAALRQAVCEVVGELDHVLRPGQHSAQGRYRSLSLELVVFSKEQRDAIFRGLSEHPAVRWLL
jgi:putative lipoic acid-binding regulatory protein